MPSRFGGLEVDRQHEFRRLLDRQVGRLLAFQNFPDVDAGTAVHLRKINAIADMRPPSSTFTFDA